MHPSFSLERERERGKKVRVGERIRQRMRQRKAEEKREKECLWKSERVAARERWIERQKVRPIAIIPSTNVHNKSDSIGHYN